MKANISSSLPSKPPCSRDQLAKGFFDGASQGNPRASEVHDQLANPSREKLELSHGLGRGTNKNVELATLDIILGIAWKVGLKHLEIYGDSRVVIKWIEF